MCGVSKHKKLICILWLSRVYKLDPCRPAALNSVAALVTDFDLDFEARRKGQPMAHRGTTYGTVNSWTRPVTCWCVPVQLVLQNPLISVSRTELEFKEWTNS